MRTLIWGVTVILMGLWSLVAWIAYELVAVGGNAVAANADLIPADPEMIEWASWLAVIGTDIGAWLIVAVWAVVALVMLGVATIATKLLPRRNLTLPPSRAQ